MKYLLDANTCIRHLNGRSLAIVRRVKATALGRLIGPNDLMIDAIALAHNLMVVTHNTSEFGRIPRLKLEDWEA